MRYIAFWVLHDETRWEILRLLAQQPRIVNTLADTLGRDRSTISRHLARLRRAKLVSFRWIAYKKHSCCEYSLNRATLRYMERSIKELLP